MRIKHRFAFNCEKSQRDITDFLDGFGIKYEITQPIKLIIFEVFEDEVYSKQVKDFMNSYSQKPWSELVYTKNDLNDASWLTIRAKWRAEYPQPEDNFEYKKISYNVLNYCDVCGCGLSQQNNFRLKNTPLWGKRNFLMLNWLHDELFTTDVVAQELRRSDLLGFSIRNVDHYKTVKHLPNTNQIQVMSYLQDNMIFEEGDIAQKIKCTKCGFVKLIRSGTGLIRFPDDALRNVNSDIVKTSEKFGDGFDCFSLILVSRKFFDFLKKNNWDKELYAQPVYVISKL